MDRPTMVSFTEDDLKDPRLDSLEREYRDSPDYRVIYDDPDAALVSESARYYIRVDVFERRRRQLLDRMATEELRLIAREQMERDMESRR